MATSDIINGIETKNISKVNSIADTQIIKMGGHDIQFAPPVPIGLIIFHNSTSIPSGWERFSSADDKLIIGAGDTYSVGDQGGSDNVTNYHSQTSTNGYHSSGGSFPFEPNVTSFGGRLANQNNGTAGNHFHTSTLNYVPNKQKLLLLKATEIHNELPIDCTMPSISNISGLTNITSYNDKYLQSGSSIGSISGSSIINFSSAGNHNHARSASITGTNQYSTQKFSNISAGNHSPSSQIPSSITDNLKKVLLSLWTNASSQFGPEYGMIAMYESTTAPDGWLLCDGTNNTPDLRDGFIRPVSSGNEVLTPSGDNTIDVAAVSVSHSATHNHQGSVVGYDGDWRWLQHENYTWSHSHSLTAISDISWLPPYYALSFIMKS